MKGARRLAIMAQWSSAGDVPPHVKVHLEGLRPLVDRLVLVSNSVIDRASRQQVSDICDKVIERSNVGWDFGAWRDAIKDEELDRWDHVLLTNSSVIGPLHPLQPIFEEMEQRQLDFWGMIQSKQFAPHLQSYFLAFSNRVVVSESWSRFWASVSDTTSKNRVILQGEIGLTQRLAAAGFCYDAWFPFLVFPDSMRKIPAVTRPFRGWLAYPYDANFRNRSIIMHDLLVRQGFPYLEL